MTKIEENDKQETIKKEPKKVKKNKEEEEILKLNEALVLEKEKSLRIQAEMFNFKKRRDEELINIRKYANEDILKELLLMIDNFERSLQYEDETNENIFKGFKMIYNNMLELLKNNEVVEIESINQAFDPTKHQAILTEVVEGVEPGIVIEVLQKGYMYKDKVLRVALVKVSA